MKATKFVAVIAAAGLVLAACGDDDDDDAASDTTAAEESTATTEESTATTAAGATDTTAAGGSATTAAGTTPAMECEPREPVSEVNIGLVTDVGKVDDKSFNQSAWEGAQAAAEEQGGTAEFIETAAATDYANNIGQFIDSGSTIIITVGSALGEATAAAAEENPDVTFIGVDQAGTVCNYTGLRFREDQAGFLAGALAGLLTETNNIAAVLGTDLVPPVVAFGEGFENGAEYINPDVEVSSTYHPGGLDVAFTDPEWGATTARQALDNGADVVFGAGGSTGNGALIEVAKEDGMLCIGVDTDQWETLPEAHPCLVTSAMKLIIDGVVELVAQAVDGSIAGGDFQGAVGLADFHDLADRVPDDVVAQMNELTTQVLAGEVETGYTP